MGSHPAKLEEAGYVNVVKGYTGKQPQTTISLTAQGGSALIGYRENLLAALAPVAE
ncbi:MAG: transcriptional regulator [Acidimicrobiia bacterium]